MEIFFLVEIATIKGFNYSYFKYFMFVNENKQLNRLGFNSKDHVSTPILVSRMPKIALFHNHQFCNVNKIN